MRQLRTSVIPRSSAVLALFVVIIVLSGCGVHKPFELYDGNYQVKSGTVAVVSGYNEDANAQLAEFLTQHLKQKSTFRVLSQEEVGRRLGRYPQTIKRATPKDTDKPVWYAPGEKGRIDSMQSQLKTDYLFVVWLSDLSKFIVTNSRGGSKITYSAAVLGNFVEYPRGKPVAYSNFANSKDRSCCLFGKSEGDDIEELLKGSAEEMADNFVKVTNSEKKSK